MNLYSYVRNVPTTRFDADGHCAEDACVIEGGTGLVVLGIAAVAGAEAVLSTPQGQRSLQTFTSAAGQSISNSIQSIKNFLKPNAVPAPQSNPAPGTQTKADNPARPGTLGKPDHQETVKQEAERINGKTEVTIPTDGGMKGSRRADAAGTNQETGQAEIVQVYRPTAAGNVPKREVDAANDIQNATGVKPTMVPVRPLQKKEGSQ